MTAILLEDYRIQFWKWIIPAKFGLMVSEKI
jgi:hypothetical protein